jgi:two-component system, OmpR family, heavy metal sensor histidine kinase CusS
MFRSLSLTTRLTLFFTLAAAAVVFGLALLVIAASERHFIELDHMALQDKQHLIEDILARSNSTEDAKWLLREALRRHHGVYVSVHDSKGETLFQSEGFRPSRELPPADESNAKYKLQHWADEGRAFRGMGVRVIPAYDATTRLDILVAMDTAHHTRFMLELRRTLMTYAVVTIVICGFLSWLAAYKGLAPLRAMQSRATMLTSQRLHQRMPVEAVPIEMADLAHELNKMLDRLEDAFTRLSEFSSNLAHELRTPLSNLLTQTQVALATPRDADTYREILASNAEEMQRLGRMVSDMLFLAKAERGMMLPNRERFSAAEETHPLIEFYEAVADEKGVRLTQHGEGEILGDRLMFRRALSNLLSNALRHTPQYGAVMIEISQSSQATQVTIENTGEDIEPKILPRLFDRFYRVDPSRSHPETDGAGLGLAITRAIMEAHGGSISATSAQGRTRFCLEFPGGTR